MLVIIGGNFLSLFLNVFLDSLGRDGGDYDH